MSKQAFSEFYDMIPYIILKAPDHFPTDYEMDLEKAFSELNKKLEESEKELGQFCKEIKDKVSDSYRFYQEGDIRNGIKSLQSVDNIIRDNKLNK